MRKNSFRSSENAYSNGFRLSALMAIYSCGPQITRMTSFLGIYLRTLRFQIKHDGDPECHFWRLPAVESDPSNCVGITNATGVAEGSGEFGKRGAQLILQRLPCSAYDGFRYLNE